MIYNCEDDGMNNSLNSKTNIFIDFISKNISKGLETAHLYL